MKLFKRGTDATPAADGENPPAPRQGHGNLIPAIVLAVGMLGGGFLLGNGSGGAPPAEAAPAPAAAHAVEEVATHGPVQNLDPITLNLADGHFLKVGLGLQLAPDDGGGHGSGDGEDLPSAKALDIAISLLGTYSMDDLTSPADRELVKKKLSKLVSEAYTDPETAHPLVTKVYFTEFVMQ